MKDETYQEHQERMIINTYMSWWSRNYDNDSWSDIFEIADRIESQEGYVLIMHHNTFLFKNTATEGYAPVQTYHSEPEGRINAAHECLVKMIRYVNELKQGKL